MRNSAEETAVRNLADALERLNDDLDRVELWTVALGCFQHPVPDYQAGNEYLLPPSSPQQRRDPKG